MVNDEIISKHTFDFGLIIILMILSSITIYASTHDDYFTVHKRALELLQDDGTYFIVNYEMKSTTFSAQNDIIINTTAWANTDFMIKHQNDSLSKMDTLYIYFLGSSTALDTNTPNGVFEPTLIMQKGKDGRFHGGPYTISYQEEGNKCTLLSTKPVEYTIDVCGDKQLPFVKITPVDSIIQYKNNKLVAGLTWVLIAFSVISARDPLFDIFFRKVSKVKQTSKDEKDENITRNQKCRIRDWFRKTKHTESESYDKIPDKDKELK